MRLVPAVSPKGRAVIETEATAFLGRHFPSHLKKPGAFPVIRMFDLLGTEYDLNPGVAELPNGVEGMTWPDGRVDLSESTYKLAIRGNGRARFTVPHECYHGLAHRHQLERVLVHTGGIVLHRRGEIEPFRDPEWQANTFASFILMPTATMKMLFSSTSRTSLVSAVMHAFGVSKKAAEIRLHVMGVQ